MEPKCALVLLLEFLGIREMADRSSLWIEWVNKNDCCGADAVAEELGIETRQVVGLMKGPVLAAALAWFEEQTEIKPDTALYRFMKRVGDTFFDRLVGFQAAWELFDKEATYTELYGVGVIHLDKVMNRNEILTMGAWRYEKHPNAALSVTHDSRGSGYSLFRFGKEDRVDFRKLILEKDPVKYEEGINFAHITGFLATTKDLNQDTATKSIIKSFTFQI